MPPHDSLTARAARILAGGPGTFSKSAAYYPQGIAPEALVSGNGCYVTGTDGAVYLDTVSALGAIILGYNDRRVVGPVFEQMVYGTSFSMLHPLEVEVAELLCDLLPCAEMVRFMRNGTDATNAAVRLARAVTGKQHVIFAGYHGGGMDSYGVTTDRSAGILPQIADYNHQTAWGDLPTVPHHVYDDLACIMVEVPPALWGATQKALSTTLATYEAIAHAHGALFVLDEIVTFPRYDLNGAQGLYGCLPDLCCVSKAIANGLPLAALVGKRQYMERLNNGDIFVSTTFAGETTALAACKATLEILRDTDALTNLHTQGQALGDGLQALFQAYDLPVSLWGHPSRLSVWWQDTPQAKADVLRTLWLAEMTRGGVLMGVGVILPQTNWTSREVTTILRAAEQVCAVIAHALEVGNVADVLPCPVIRPVVGVR